jgi:hypothetical protein
MLLLSRHLASRTAAGDVTIYPYRTLSEEDRDLSVPAYGVASYLAKKAPYRGGAGRQKRSNLRRSL